MVFPSIVESRSGGDVRVLNVADDLVLMLKKSEKVFGENIVVHTFGDEGDVEEHLVNIPFSLLIEWETTARNEEDARLPYSKIPCKVSHTMFTRESRLSLSSSDILSRTSSKRRTRAHT